MININAYDYARTGLDLARLALGTTVDVKSKQKDVDTHRRGQTLDYMAKTYATDKSFEGTKYAKDVDAQLKREEFKNRKEVQKMINDNEIILRSMGISSDQLIARINNLSAENRERIKGEIAKAVQALRNENVLDAIEEQYQRNINELNLKEDEAMKRAVLGGFFQLLASDNPLFAGIKSGEGTVLVDVLKDVFPGIETWNDTNFGFGGKGNERKEADREIEKQRLLEERMESYDQAIKNREKPAPLLPGQGRPGKAVGNGHGASAWF